jgi:hypothetical protein
MNNWWLNLYLMGIPSLFSNYYRKFKKEGELLILLKDIKNVDYLLFDYNSLIHPAAYQILSANEDLYLKNNVNTNEIEKDIINNCIIYTKLIINSIKSKKVYIMIDGVAPRSKMNQQRERRYKSYFFKEIENKSNLWDSNKITPGTEFMDLLTKELHLQFPEVIISDSNQPGEGEHKMMKMLSETKGKVCIYGLDCITEDTPLLLQNENGDIEIQTVERLTNIWNTIDEKEYGKTNYKVWSETGWTKIKNIRRNKTNKDIFRVLTNTGCIDVTEDHKLLKSNNNIIKPIDCKIGDNLLNKFPSFNDNKIVIPNNLEKIKRQNLNKLASSLKIKQYQKNTKNNLIEKINNIYDNHIFLDFQSEFVISTDEAYIMGLFWADGSCGIYNSKKNPDWKTYQWYISNCDLKLLQNTKIKLEQCYNHLGINFTIIKNKHNNKDNCNRLHQYKLNANGGLKKLILVEKYIKMFYYKNKHSVFKNGNKYICKEILNANKNIRFSFFLGYYNGDGTGHSLNVISKSMDVESKISTQCIYYLCKSLGYEVSVNIRDDKPSVYKLTITKGYQVKQSNKIKKIKNLGKTNNYVYDLETDNHHFQSGIGDLIIHNCDLIMLSLLNKYSDNIILIRDTKFGELSEIDYLNIKQLKQYIFKDFNYKFKYELEQEYQGNITQFIDDYILLCFMLGNDFLDHLFCIKIRENGIDIILKAYIKAFSGESLVDKRKEFKEWINLKFLKDIFYQLKNYESYYLKQNKRNFPNKDLSLPQIQILNESENNLFFYDNLNLIETNLNNYKDIYYTFYNIFDLDNVCLNYIEGLYWVLGYYNNHIHNNWSWYYKYHTIPFCNDIFNYLNKKQININIKESKPFTQDKQLLLVLPKESFLNLNKSNTFVTNNKNIFPSKLFVDLNFKEYLWQSKILFDDINENIIDLI